MRQLLRPLRLLLPALLLGGFSSYAQAPANDNPTGAIALTLGTTCTPTNATNLNATTTAVTGLGYTNPGCAIAASPKDVWFTFTTAASGAGSTSAIIQVTGTVAGQVRVFRSTGGAAGPFTELGCSAGTTNNTQAPALPLYGLTPSTTYYVFVSGYGSADTTGPFTICAVTPPANDAAVLAIQTMGTVSSTYGSPVTVSAVVRNTGTSTLTSLPVTLAVSGATTFNNVQTVATLASGASATVTFTAYPVTTAGVNTLSVSVPNDGNTANNSLPYSQTVTAGGMGYIDTTQPLVNPVGVGVANGALAVRYNTNSAATVTSIIPTFQGAGTTGTTYQLQVYGNNAGVPGTLLYTSATLTRPAASGAVPTAIPNIAVSGTFFVAIKELNNNVALAYQTEDPLRSGTFLFTTTGTTWTDVNTTTLKTRLALDVVLAAPSSCAPVTGLTVGSITNTGASVSFTAPTGATGYIVTYTPTSGTATTVTPAPTTSPVTLSGLSAGTTYVVSVTNNCGTGGNSSPVTASFTTTGTAAGPANDNCSGATPLTVGTTCTPITSTNTGATASTGVPAPASGTATSCFVAATPINNDVWYTVVVPASGAVTVTTSAVTGSPVTDTGLVIYSGTCTSLTEIACSDDISTTNGFSSATAIAPAGSTLYVREWSFGATPTGQFGICAVSASSAVCANPTNATIGTPTATSVSLTFTPGASNTGYIVTYYPTATPANVTTVTPNPTASPITVNGLTPSTAYTITLQSVCANGAQGAVLSGTFTTAAGSACAAVTGLSVGSTTTTGGVVSFTGNASATSYTVTYGVTGSGTTTTVTPAPTASPVTLSGLTAGTSYTVTVVANCAGGASTATTTTFNTSGSAPGCNPVTNAAVSSVTATSAVLSFTTVAGAVNYTATLSNGTTTGTPTTLTSGGPIAVSNLTAGTTYTITLVTNCTGGGVSTPVVVTFTTTGPPVNDNPSGAIALTVGTTCTPTNTSNANATATAPNGYTNPANPQFTCGSAGNPSDVWYTFTLPAGSTAATITVTGNPAGSVRVFSSAAGAAGPFTQVGCSSGGAANTVAPPLPLTGLTAGTTYYIAVAGYGSFDTAGAFTICVTRPTQSPAVTNVTVGAITQNSASVAFTAPTGATPTGYTVTYTAGGSTVTVSGSASPIALTGLTPNTTYTVTVVANYAGGNSTAVTSTFTTTISGVRTALGNGTLSVYPNPAHRAFTLALPAISGARTAQLTLLNSLGQQVRTSTIELNANGTQTQVDVVGLATGLYTLRVQAGQQTATQQVAVQ